MSRIVCRSWRGPAHLARTIGSRRALRSPSTTPSPRSGGGPGGDDVLKVVEEVPDDPGTVREHLDLLLDVVEATTQLGATDGQALSAPFSVVQGSTV